MHSVMDVEKAKGKKRGVAHGGSELVLQWGTSKRLRAGKKEPTSANNAVLKKPIKTDKQTNQTGKQACRPCKQAPGDAKYDPSKSSPQHCQNKKPIKRYNSSISSVPEGKGTKKHKLSASSKSCAKSKGGKYTLDTFKDTEMVLGRRGLEAGIHIGTFHDELQNLEVYLMPKFMIALSHKEKEEDFMAIKGSKLPIRPKRRAKHVQKALHCVTPGSWLCELSLDRYEVREKKNAKKKSLGLKAMISHDSDSLKS